MLTSTPVNAVFTASDPVRARAFYSDKLGLQTEDTEDPGGGFYVNAGAGTKIFIYNNGEPKATNTVASFKTSDVRVEVKELKENGVEFESYDMGPVKTDEDNVASMGDLNAAWFKDSEGNIICISNQ